MLEAGAERAGPCPLLATPARAWRGLLLASTVPRFCMGLEAASWFDGDKVSPSLGDASPLARSEPGVRGLSTAAQLVWPGLEDAGPSCRASREPGLTVSPCVLRAGTGRRPGSPSRAGVPPGDENGADSRGPLPELRPRPPPRPRRASSPVRARCCMCNGGDALINRLSRMGFGTTRQGHGTPCPDQDCPCLQQT